MLIPGAYYGILIFGLAGAEDFRCFTDFQERRDDYEIQK